MSSHTCVYIVRIPKPGVSEYCGERVPYTIHWDEDLGRRVRKYGSFCQEHQEKVDSEPEDE